MSPAAETRVNMLLNAILKIYEAMAVVGHAPCSWAKPLVRYFEWFYAIVVNLMHFTLPQPQTDSAHLSAYLRPLKRD